MKQHDNAITLSHLYFAMPCNETAVQRGWSGTDLSDLNTLTMQLVPINIYLDAIRLPYNTYPSRRQMTLFG